MRNLAETQKRKQPPYATKLREALEGHRKLFGSSPNGRYVSVWLICGSRAWDKASELADNHAFLLLPPFDDPGEYDWHLLAGHDPIIALVAGDPPSWPDLAAALIRDGVQRFLRPADDGSGIRHLSPRVVSYAV